MTVPIPSADATSDKQTKQFCKSAASCRRIYEMYVHAFTSFSWLRCFLYIFYCLTPDVKCFFTQVLGPLLGNTLFTEEDFKLLENFDMDLYARKVRDQVC